MLNEEYKKGDSVWYKDDFCKYKIKELNDRAVVWVNYKDYDIAKPMLLWDFQKETDEYDIKLKINTEWSKYFGFEINKEDIFIFIGLIENLISRWSPENMNLDIQYIDWYK